jgi:hypothetical protein
MEAKDLEDRIEKFKKYYYKGAGAMLCGIFATASVAANEEKGRAKRLECLKDKYCEYITNYPKVDFEEINGDSDFAPLIVIHKLNNKLERTIDNFVEEPSEDGALRLHFLTNSILEVGDVYRDSFRATIEMLQKKPGYKNFGFIITDCDGRKYNTPI